MFGSIVDMKTQHANVWSVHVCPAHRMTMSLVHRHVPGDEEPDDVKDMSCCSEAGVSLMYAVVLRVADEWKIGAVVQNVPRIAEINWFAYPDVLLYNIDPLVIDQLLGAFAPKFHPHLN